MAEVVEAVVLHEGSAELEASPLEEARSRMERVLRRWNRGRSPHTLRARLSDLRAFGAYVGVGDDAEPWVVAVELVRHGADTAADRVDAWLAAMKGQGLAPTTRARRVSTLRSLTREMARDGLRWDLAVRPPKVNPYDNVVGDPPEQVEEAINTLTLAAMEEEKRALRSLLALLLMYDSGLRISEATSLKVTDYDRRRNAVHVVRKGDRLVWRTVSERTKQILEQRLGQLREGEAPAEDPHLVGIGPRHLRDVIRGLGLAHPHALRHTAASEIARLTKDPRAVQEFLGHQSLMTAQVYLDRTRDLAGFATRVLAGEADPSEADG